ncbi:MAG: ABC transporter substrate-binding protein [Cyanophyceae cyanobacterium]
MGLGILTVLIVACSPSEHTNSEVSSSTNCQTLQHDAGKTEICNRPQRIVAIGPNMLEILLALDVEPVGYADYFSLPSRQFDRPSQQIPFLGERVTNQPINLGSADAPSPEKIAQLQPDLILGDIYANQDQYDLLSQIAPTLLFTYAVDEQWQKQMRSIAQALGKSEQAEQVIAQHLQRIAQAKTALQPIASQYPRVLLLGSQRLDQGIEIDPYNHDSYCSALMADLGFQLVFPPNSEGKEGQGGNVSLELLPQLPADLIVIEAYSTDFSHSGDVVNQQIASVKQQWNSNEIAQSLRASQSDRVYFTSAYLCRAMPGPIGAEIFLNQLQQQLL